MKDHLHISIMHFSGNGLENSLPNINSKRGSRRRRRRGRKGKMTANERK